MFSLPGKHLPGDAQGLKMATAQWNIRLLCTYATASVPARWLRPMALRVYGGLVAVALLGSSGAGSAQDVSSANQLIHRLYADDGQVGQHHPYPLWWRFLSARTKAQFVRLRALDA